MMDKTVTPITINIDGRKTFKIKLSIDDLAAAQFHNYIIVKDAKTGELHTLRPVFHTAHIFTKIYALIDFKSEIFNIINPHVYTK